MLTPEKARKLEKILKKMRQPLWLLLIIPFVELLTAHAELIRIDANSLSSPPYSLLKESIRVLSSADLEANRYITYLGSWENNGEANWERSSWWGRFYIDCKDKTFKVYHFKHKHIGRDWRPAERNYTALYGLELYCPKIKVLTEEAKSIDTLNQEFTKQEHDKTAPLRAVH